MTNEARQSSGVQELITRIRDDGVQAGNQRAEEIIAEARKEAARVVAESQTQAEEIQNEAADEIESFKQAALESLKLAARDTRLQLEAEVLASFEAHVKRLVAPVTFDGSFVRALIMVLAGQVADQYPRDQQLEIFVSDMLAGRDRENPDMDRTIRENVLGISGNMLREGVEIIPSSDVPGGARIKLVGEDLEIDMTDDAISRLLLKHMLPRYKSILEGAE